MIESTRTLNNNFVISFSIKKKGQDDCCFHKKFAFLKQITI